MKPLGCTPVLLSYCWEQRAGFLTLEDHHCPDMTACIQMFISIDPNVRLIQTISGPETDTQYVRLPSNKWEARVPK
jgi:hypothetical protein